MNRLAIIINKGQTHNTYHYSISTVNNSLKTIKLNKKIKNEIVEYFSALGRRAAQPSDGLVCEIICSFKYSHSLILHILKSLIDGKYFFVNERGVLLYNEKEKVKFFDVIFRGK